MKNPLVQMALPFALSYFMPGIGSLVGTSAISNPMMRSAAEQAMLGYGTAALTGSKHPEKAAMYAGLGSMPFSFMKAQGAADAFNKAYVGKDPSIYKTQRDLLTPAIEGQAGFWDGPGGLESQLGIGTYNPPVTAAEATYSPWRLPTVKGKPMPLPQKLDAWDVLSGDKYNIPPTRNLEYTGLGDPVFNEAGTDLLGYRPETAWDTAIAAGDISEGIIPGQTDMEIPVDFYSKTGKGQKNLLGATLEEGVSYPDFTPTIASQTAGWYGGRPTEEEEWEDAKARRRKELAFMYGIDESLMGGELQNPYYGGGGFWKDGGIAALQMDAGGAVNGPGGPKDDVIDAKLSDGEFVMTAKAVENFGGGNRLAGAKRMYNMMNQLDPQSETVGESVIGV